MRELGFAPVLNMQLSVSAVPRSRLHVFQLHERARKGLPLRRYGSHEEPRMFYCLTVLQNAITAGLIDAGLIWLNTAQLSSLSTIVALLLCCLYS